MACVACIWPMPAGEAACATGRPTRPEGGASDRPLMCVPSQIHPFSESENHYIQAAWVEDEMGTVLFLQCEGGFARVRPCASAPSIRD